MSMRRLSIFCLTGLLVIGIGFFLYKANEAEEERDALRFSNTQEWDSQLVVSRESPLIFLNDWEKTITLPLPPTNTSSETEGELHMLLAYKELRTSEKIQAINDEIILDTEIFADHPFNDYFDYEKFPHTARLLRLVYSDVLVVTFKLKHRFDRVRPSFLIPSIEPVTDVPRHPAYPSGHSTQSYFLAYFLGALQPSQQAILVETARQIAVDREIAGVHYPSDTKAGMLLAEQLFTELQKKKDFQVMFEAAKSEWK